MPCYRPVTAYNVPGAAISFNPASGGRKIQIACNNCIGCRWGRQQAWAIRCMHEAKMHKENCFITLTFDEEHYKPSLDYSDYQQFMRRLRHHIRPGQVRYFAAGEYGELKSRPHYHACLFGLDFRDRKRIAKNLDQSDTLTQLWGQGQASVGDITFASARYCATYVCKKITGAQATEHYKRLHLATGEIISVEPEEAHMSLKPGIGYTWFNKYWKDVYAGRDGVVLERGRTVPAPKYYDKLLERISLEQLEEKKRKRRIRLALSGKDRTPERLAVRETVHKARINFYKRETL